MVVGRAGERDTEGVHGVGAMRTQLQIDLLVSWVRNSYRGLIPRSGTACGSDGQESTKLSAAG